MRYILILLTFFSTVSCKKKATLNNSKKIDIIKTCIDRVLETKEGIQISNCYIVNPYLNKILFEEGLDNKKQELYEKLYLKQIDINVINKKQDIEFLQKLTDFSVCKSSYTILDVSLINDNIVYVELIDCKTEIDIQKLTSSYNFNNVNQVYSYCFILKNDGQIDKFFVDGIYYD